MCGIAGFVGFGSVDDLQAMTDEMKHRGPDGQGIWVAPDVPVFLGHRRLSIIDLESGAQPMWDAAGQIGVVFNGEIYNHMELRRDLERAGHRFQSSHSDTEVLIHGYREWGDDLPRRLNGMFAFAIYDRRRRTLFLARDRFGEKPLYVYRRPGRIAFASELSALTRHSGIHISINPHSVQKLFAWGFIPAPNALYRDCQKLRPGCSLSYSLDDDTVKERAYWTFKLEPDNSLDDSSVPLLAEELRELLARSVKLRLMSDVPLGVFLSGGIDSGAVLAAATRELPPSSVSTFTIGFNEPSFDESGYARALAKHFGVRHHEDSLDMSRAQQLIPQVLGAVDEPIGDASILPTYLLSRFTRQHVTVALSGDGGDEMFAGYDPFKALTPAKIYSYLVPKGLHRGLRRLSELLPISTRNMSFDFRLRRTLTGLSWPPQYWNPIWLAPADPKTIADIFEEPVEADALYAEALDVWNETEGNLVDKTLEFYTKFYLSDSILAKVDRASMMVSLETRAIFLDTNLVEFCARLPSRFKYRRGTTKWLLKQALVPWLPAEILQRRKKGFGIPLAKWLKTVPTVPPLAPVQGMRMERVEGLWNRHREGVEDNRLFLWSWLALQSVLH